MKYLASLFTFLLLIQITWAEILTQPTHSFPAQSELITHDNQVSAVAFSADGKRVATASGVMMLWDTETGQQRLWNSDEQNCLLRNQEVENSNSLDMLQFINPNSHHTVRVYELLYLYGFRESEVGKAREGGKDREQSEYR